MRPEYFNGVFYAVKCLFKMLNSTTEYFFKIEDPMNLYHAELHIPSDRAKHGIPCTNFKTDNTAANVF